LQVRRCLRAPVRWRAARQHPSVFQVCVPFVLAIALQELTRRRYPCTHEMTSVYEVIVY
jgi:hypothetical protein